TPEVHPFPIECAGQDVGRGCILVSIGGKNIMLDCGMHMGFNDARTESVPPIGVIVGQPESRTFMGRDVCMRIPQFEYCWDGHL
uniref:Uncharacterized protein n=1 Tax=Oncorhynchus mykiss TaxID=8022 RepID=A0A8C7QPD8_ONCMY